MQSCSLELFNRDIVLTAAMKFDDKSLRCVVLDITLDFVTMWYFRLRPLCQWRGIISLDSSPTSNDLNLLHHLHLPVTSADTT